MSKFQKVSELEWYLHMEAFHKAFGVRSRINGQNHTMDLKEFHDFWTELRAPGYNKHRNEVILNAPFNINFFLYPTQAIEIPLGFSLPEDFEIIQGKKDNYIVSVHKMPGTIGGIGYVLRIINVFDEPCTYQCSAGDPMISGYLIDLDNDPQREKTKYKVFFRDQNKYKDDLSNEEMDDQMVFAFPGVFRQNDIGDIDQYYLACEHNGTDPCIHIMKKGGVEPNLLRDVAVYTYHPDDFDPKTDPTGAFRRRFALATAGEEIIPRKRYYLPYKKIETILI